MMTCRVDQFTEQMLADGPVVANRLKASHEVGVVPPMNEIAKEVLRYATSMPNNYDAKQLVMMMTQATVIRIWPQKMQIEIGRVDDKNGQDIRIIVKQIAIEIPGHSKRNADGLLEFNDVGATILLPSPPQGFHITWQNSVPRAHASIMAQMIEKKLREQVPQQVETGAV